ncbi:hypothetical protein [Clostridium thermobutyricum]|nr:hypothetical protein [Clostridium thermobutyricum]
MQSAGDIAFPQNYNYSNALKLAQLIFAETVDRNKVPVLQSCNR